LLAITAYYKSCIKSESSYWIETQQIMDIKLINKQAKTTQEMDRIKLYRVLISYSVLAQLMRVYIVILDSNWIGI